MSQSNIHASRFRGLSTLLAAILGVGVAFACSDLPTQVATNEAGPLLKRGGGKGPPPPASTTLSADLVNQVPGVTGDGGDSYTDSHVTDRFRLVPKCDDPRRDMSLTGVDLSGTSESLTNQSTCNGGADNGRLILHLPDLLTTADCDGDCPFELLPSFQVKGRKLKATGAFAPTAHYFVLDLATGRTLDFVFQDAKVVTNADGSKTFTAGEAHLYVAHSFVCDGGSDGDPKNIALCNDIAIGINVTVTP